MRTASLALSAVFPVKPERLYRAWLDSREHGRMSGGKASLVPRLGGRANAWDGYIEGRIVALSPGRKIVQTWRTSEFPDGAPDSRLELRFSGARRGARLTLIHTRIPWGQGRKYAAGWRDFYFVPMRRYFARAEGGLS